MEEGGKGEKEEGRRVEGGTGREEKIRREEAGDWEKAMATSSKTSRITNIIFNQKSEVYNTFTLRRLTEMDPFSQVMFYRQRYLPG